MRVKDALTELSKQVDIDLLHPDTVLLKEPGVWLDHDAFVDLDAAKRRWCCGGRGTQI